jgi:hypothetical protein
MPRDDDYADQMKAAADRESARTAAEGNCIARTRDGELCRRRVAKELLAKGMQKCRLHVFHSSAPKRPASNA